jgi:hypothetical protein
MKGKVLLLWGDRVLDDFHRFSLRSAYFSEGGTIYVAVDQFRPFESQYID